MTDLYLIAIVDNIKILFGTIKVGKMSATNKNPKVLKNLVCTSTYYVRTNLCRPKTKFIFMGFL